jgi:hypothetical protein
MSARANWRASLGWRFGLLPGPLALRLVMLEGGVQPGQHLGGGFKERLSFGVVDLVDILPQVLNQFLKFPPNIRHMRPRVS